MNRSREELDSIRGIFQERKEERKRNHEEGYPISKS